MEDPLPDGPAKGMVIEKNTLEMLKDSYYEIRGWDKETGKPTIEKLKDLELDDLIKDIWPV
jgi:aldehyde:ferredoxin oxidoreductase